eukprot:351775_1
MGNAKSKRKAPITLLQSFSIDDELERAKYNHSWAKSYKIDWTIDRHRLTRQYLIFGIVRNLEKIFDIIVPNDISLIIFYFYYLGHRERFESYKQLEPDKQILYKQGEDIDIKARKVKIEYGTLIIDSSISNTKHIWIFRILDKNCCSIAIGLTDANTNKNILTKPIYSCCSDGTLSYMYKSLNHSNINQNDRFDEKIINSFGMEYSWGCILRMELDLSTHINGILRYGVRKEINYKDYESVVMKVGFDNIKRDKKWKMAVWLKGYEARVQLLEYFEDDNEIVTKQSTESYADF